ncbi:MAG: HD domain-containing protein [Ruthenibacterium sp.]
MLKLSVSLALNKADSLEELFECMPEDIKTHSLNVAKYSRALAKLFCENLWEELHLNAMFTACKYHDIGKSVIPESILNKAGPLDESEMDIVKEHTRLGFEIISHYVRPNHETFTGAEFEAMCKTARYHHERVDGAGYPTGITPPALPVIARICAVADTFDAITSDRPYRKADTRENALKVLCCVAGAQLDEKIVEIAVSPQNIAWTTAAGKWC